LQDGTLLGTVLVFQDVTERRRLEAMLRQSQKMESVGQLAGGIAHDVNNMLTVISGSAELLLSTNDSIEETESIIRDILGASEEAASLVRNLLNFSRRGQALSVRVDVHGVLRKTEALLRRALDRKIELEVSLAAGRVAIVGDPVQLQNAFLNIGINARDAMPNGGTLRIETSNTLIDALASEAAAFDLTPGPYIQIAIQDTGTGIPPEILDRIFEPFFSTKDVNEGTGLGLASVYGCVHDHHGSVSVNSVVGEGTVFQILVPLAVEDAAAVALPSSLAVSTIPAGLGVLLVDDEDLVRNAARRMLERAGCKVFAVAEGVQAIEIYRRHQRDISVVILDAIMPKMSGLETFVALQQINPAVIGVIASGFTRTKIKAEGMGISRFIRKPFTMDQLYQSVTEALSLPQPSSDEAGTATRISPLETC
jgi:nitrogen-specific signal transduction histidine kinase/CheY-like chemotaxis protein